MPEFVLIGNRQISTIITLKWEEEKESDGTGTFAFV